jgi:hypothetical protein
MSRDNPSELEERIRNQPGKWGQPVRDMDDMEDRGLRLMQSPETYEDGRTLVAMATAGYDGLRLAGLANERWWAIERRNPDLAWDFLDRFMEVFAAGDVAGAQAMFWRWLDWQEAYACRDAQDATP